MKHTSSPSIVHRPKAVKPATLSSPKQPQSLISVQPTKLVYERSNSAPNSCFTNEVPKCPFIMRDEDAQLREIAQVEQEMITRRRSYPTQMNLLLPLRPENPMIKDCFFKEQNKECIKSSNSTDNESGELEELTMSNVTNLAISNKSF